MFNAYEETIRVPLVISNPLLFPRGAESDDAVSLVDVVPTLLGLAGAPLDGTLDGASLGGVLARTPRPRRRRCARARPTSAASSTPPRGRRARPLLFTYDDHQAGTAQQDAGPQPNRIRGVRSERWKYAVYLDPTGRAAPEYELYDLEADPDEALKLVDKGTGRGRTAAARAALPELHEALATACRDTGMDRLAPLPPRPADPPGLFRRERGGERRPGVDPAAELGVGRDPFGLNLDEGAHRAPGEVHRADVRFAQGALGVLAIQFRHHQILAERATGHVPVDHPRDAAEHPALGDPVTGPHDVSDSGRQLLGVRHGASVRRGSPRTRLPRAGADGRRRLFHPKSMKGAACPTYRCCSP